MMIMKKIEIYDPAMCCSTGVCGPSIDPELMRVSTVISALKDKGIVIQRFGLTSDPMKFVTEKHINDLLQQEGPDVLPVTVVDGVIVKTKTYPTNDELSAWLGVEVTDKPLFKQSCCGPEGCC